MSRGITIAVVQSGFGAQDYRDPESFRQKVLSFFSGPEQPQKPPSPALVVFPELTGLWIPLLQGKAPRSLAALSLRRLAASPLQALASLLSGRGLSFAFLQGWQKSYQTWIEPFREAARRWQAYVCPGSCFLPAFDYEVATGLTHSGSELYNTSCLINPQGRILGLTRKVNLTSDELKLGIRGGSPAGLLPYRTELGSLGILVCKDGFHEQAVQQLDRQGCRIVLIPSANPKPWSEPPRPGAAVSQEEEWLAEGPGSLIQGRENIRLSVNPMSVSSLLGHRDEGRSSVFVNQARPTRLSPAPQPPAEQHRYAGLRLLASSARGEEILSFTIEV